MYTKITEKTGVWKINFTDFPVIFIPKTRCLLFLNNRNFIGLQKPEKITSFVYLCFLLAGILAVSMSSKTCLCYFVKSFIPFGMNYHWMSTNWMVLMTSRKYYKICMSATLILCLCFKDNNREINLSRIQMALSALTSHRQKVTL